MRLERGGDGCLGVGERPDEVEDEGVDAFEGWGEGIGAGHLRVGYLGGWAGLVGLG